MRLLALALVLGTVGFGVFYYLDQRVDTGPSLLDRQVSAAESAVTADPASIPARLDLARTYQLDSQLSEAIKQYDEVLRVEPAHRGALLGRGRAMYAAGDVDAAAESLRQITDTSLTGEFAGADTQLEEALYFLGEIALGAQDPKQAQRHAESALRIAATDSDALLLLGRALLAQEQPRKALKALERAAMFVPQGWADPYQAMAQAYQALGEQPGEQYALAMARFCQGDPDGAAAALTPLLDGPMAVESMLGLALVYEADSQRGKAAKFYRKVLKREPSNVAAGAGLARLRPAASETGSASGTGAHVEGNN